MHRPDAGATSSFQPLPQGQATYRPDPAGSVRDRSCRLSRRKGITSTSEQTLDGVVTSI